MKILKSSNVSFGLMDVQSNGIVHSVTKDGYTSVDDIKVTSIYSCSNDEGSSARVDDLPSDLTGVYGFIITLMHANNAGVQFFVHYNKSNASPYYPVHFRVLVNGSWQGWKRSEFTGIGG